MSTQLSSIQYNSRWEILSQDLRDFQSENKRFVVGAPTPQWLTQLKTDSGQENLKKYSIWTQRTNEHRVFAHQRLKTQISTQRTLEHKKEHWNWNTKNTKEKLFETQDPRHKTQNKKHWRPGQIWRKMSGGVLSNSVYSTSCSVLLLDTRTWFCRYKNSKQ